MNAYIITIGNELLNGTTIDTNSAWIAKELDRISINVKEIKTISDDLYGEVISNYNFASCN